MTDPTSTGTAARPLEGLGVLVTRPTHQAGPLSQLIENKGGSPIPFPVLAIAEPRHPETLEPVLEGLAQYDLAIFVSANAVERGLARVAAHGGLPAGLALAAIGRATARALEQAGYRPDLVPPDRFTSEALLALAPLQELHGQRVVIFRGEGGRELLADTLRARGAQVDYAEVYRRVAARPDPAVLMEHRAAGDLHVITATSSEALHNLCELAGADAGAWLRRLPLVVVSERMVQLARELGFQAEVIAAEPGDESLVEALTAWRLRSP